MTVPKLLRMALCLLLLHGLTACHEDEPAYIIHTHNGTSDNHRNDSNTGEGSENGSGEGSDIGPGNDPLPKPEIPVDPDGAFVVTELEDVSTQVFFSRGTEYFQFLMAMASNRDLSQLMTSTFELLQTRDIAELARSFRQDAGKLNPQWTIRLYHYCCPSHDGQGKDIQLSAVAAVPVLPSNKACHTVKSISLIHPILCLDGQSASQMLPVTALRVFKDALVVIPDLQGYGVAHDSHAATTCPELGARQALDAQLAAMKLIEADGIVLDPAYVTDNMGCSNGAAEAICCHRLIEQSTGEIYRQIRLAGTYACEGIYDYVNCLNKVDYMLSSFYSVLVPDLLASAYYQHPDFFTAYPSLDAMLLADGGLDPDNEAVKNLIRSLKADAPDWTWDTQLPILIDHSLDDDLASYNSALQTYWKLADADGQANKNVQFHHFKGQNHQFATLVGWLNCLRYDRPVKH